MPSRAAIEHLNPSGSVGTCARTSAPLLPSNPVFVGRRARAQNYPAKAIKANQEIKVSAREATALDE
jgi:hypothetical protein